MKTQLRLCLFLCLGACQLEGTADDFFDSQSDSTDEALGAAPVNPVTVVPAMPTTGVNGTLPSRKTVEPHSWLACMSKTTATCTTGSGGIGAVCGVTAPCTPGLYCIGGVCASPVALGGSCTSNGQCGTYAGAPLVCINSICRQKSTTSGPCDEAVDCQLPAGSGTAVCVAGSCRAQGDVGAPCQIATHCKTTSSTGQPLTCYIPTGSTLGTCQVVSGPGGACTDETNCNQSTAPRCIPGSEAIGRTCQLPGGTGARCDDKPDCSQAIGPSGQVCVNGFCQLNGGVGSSCTSNSNCNSGLACISNVCRSLSGNGGACDEAADCTQTQAQACQNGVCKYSGVLGGPCGTNDFCANNLSCIASNNPTGITLCISGTCSCPPADYCYLNSHCLPTATGAQQVCVPGVGGDLTKHCQPVQNPPAGCCDEKEDCRPIGASTCLMSPGPLGCFGGHCVVGKTQGQTCTTSDECSGSLVCKINTLVPGRTYTTCEY